MVGCSVVGLVGNYHQQTDDTCCIVIASEHGTMSPHLNGTKRVIRVNVVKSDCHRNKCKYVVLLVPNLCATVGSISR